MQHFRWLILGDTGNQCREAENSKGVVGFTGLGGDGSGGVRAEDLGCRLSTHFPSFPPDPLFRDQVEGGSSKSSV